MLDHYGMDSPTLLILMTVFYLFFYLVFFIYCHSSSKDGFLSRADCLVRFEMETFLTSAHQATFLKSFHLTMRAPL